MKNEVRALTGLRGIAALTVAIGHFNLMNHFFFRKVSIHNEMVDLFFCLSAFTLCYVYLSKDGKKLDFRNYAVARFARIYPLYFLCLMAATFLLLQDSIYIKDIYPESAIRADFLRQLFMVNALPFGSGVHWDSPAWSLSIEAFCYVAVFPVLYFAAPKMRSTSISLRITVTLIACAIAMLSMAAYYKSQLTNYGHPDLPWQADYVAIVRGIGLFIAGWAIYISYECEDIFSRFILQIPDVISLIFILTVGLAYVGYVKSEIFLFVWPLMILSLMSPDSRTTTFIVQANPLAWRDFLFNLPLALLDDHCDVGLCTRL